MDAHRGRRGRLSVALLVILLSTTLAGCTDQDEVDPVVASVRERSNALVPVDPFEPVDTGDGACEGCIRLRTADDRITIEPAPGKATLSPEAPRVYQIPFPRGGDVVHVKGQRALDDGASSAERLVADDASGRYAMRFQWQHGDGQAPGARRGDGQTVRILAQDLSEGGTEDHSLLGHYDLEGATWHVSTANRLVVGIESHLHSTAVSNDGPDADPSPRIEAERTQTPQAGELYWLGSHFWGRTISGPERFSTTWTTPGTDDVAVRFDHHVTHIYEDDVPTETTHDFHDHHRHSSSPAATQIETRIAGYTTATDLHGNQVRWRFTLDPESPYPERIQRTMARSRSIDTTELPIMVLEQSATLLERGTNDLPFLDRHVQTRATTPSDPRFALIERDVPPVLGTLPVYPLGRAETDLMTLEPEFADWRGSGSILVSADLDRIDAVADDDSATLGLRVDTVPQLRWTLRYVDGEGEARAWTVSRSYDPAAGLGPVPLESGRVTAGHISSALLMLHRGLLWNHDLGTGDLAFQAVNEAGWDGPVDTVRYGLVVAPEQSHIGGHLVVAHRPPGFVVGNHMEEADHRAGLVYEDLGLGLIEETWTLSVHDDV